KYGNARVLISSLLGVSEVIGQDHNAMIWKASHHGMYHHGMYSVKCMDVAAENEPIAVPGEW
ncbi:hypothetical protein A2U01_0018451, partial [Trifolium medium]|nr:hypothetical protein [Trifolium medium]